MTLSHRMKVSVHIHHCLGDLGKRLGAASMQEVTMVPQKSTVRRGWARCAEGTHSSLELTAWQPCWLIPSAAGVLSCPVLPRQRGPLAAHMLVPWHGNSAWLAQLTGHPWPRAMFVYISENRVALGEDQRVFLYKEFWHQISVWSATRYLMLSQERSRAKPSPAVWFFILSSRFRGPRLGEEVEVDQQSLNYKCWGTGMSKEGRKVLSSNSSGGSYQHLMLFFFLFFSVPEFLK